MGLGGGLLGVAFGAGQPDAGVGGAALIGTLAATRSAARAELLADCLQRLDLMRTSRQVKALNEVLTAVVGQ